MNTRASKKVHARSFHTTRGGERVFALRIHRLFSAALSFMLVVSLLATPLFRAHAEEVSPVEPDVSEIADTEAEKEASQEEEGVEGAPPEEVDSSQSGSDIRNLDKSSEGDSAGETPQGEGDDSSDNRAAAEDGVSSAVSGEADAEEAPQVDEDHGTTSASVTPQASGEDVQGATTSPIVGDGGASQASSSLPVDNVLEEGLSSVASTTATTTPPVASSSPSTGGNASSSPPQESDAGGESAEPVATTTEETVDAVDENVQVPESPKQDDEAVDQPAEDVSTTTPVVSTESISVVVNDSNRFQFGVNECVSVGDGSFYCSHAEGESVISSEHVFTDYDEDGDREIYATINGKTVRVTDNTIDDDEPFYDPVSNRIVWHASISGRYQIFSYSIDSKTHTQLTETRYNNMQATAYGDVTVWQAWIDDNWEIVLFEEGETIRLTENTTHDIAPHVRGDYILWQAFEGDAWYVKVYDRSTGLTETIEGSAGASAENPRFVLVYDSKNENGDVETRGYDLASKQVVPLSSTPAPVPERLPEPEESGEERALIQQSTPKTETRITETDDGGGGDGSDDDGSGEQATASTTVETVSDDDIVVPASNEAVDKSEDVGTSTVLSDPAFEIVVPPYTSSTTTEDVAEAYDDET